MCRAFCVYKARFLVVRHSLWLFHSFHLLLQGSLSPQGRDSMETTLLKLGIPSSLTVSTLGLWVSVPFAAGGGFSDDG